MHTTTATPIPNDEYQTSSGLPGKVTAWIGLVTGHDFSHAAKVLKINEGFSPAKSLSAASATELDTRRSAGTKLIFIFLICSNFQALETNVWSPGLVSYCNRSTMMARDQVPPVFVPLAVRLSVCTAEPAASGNTLTYVRPDEMVAPICPDATR